METTRPPAARVASIARAVAGGDLAPFGMHRVGVGVVDPHRLEGAGADMQRDARRGDAASASAAISSGVKCRPAVGAATEPSCLANSVW